MQGREEVAGRGFVWLSRWRRGIGEVELAVETVVDGDNPLDDFGGHGVVLEAGGRPLREVNDAASALGDGEVDFLFDFVGGGAAAQGTYLLIRTLDEDELGLGGKIRDAPLGQSIHRHANKGNGIS